MSHAAPGPQRRWFFRRKRPAPVVDLRDRSAEHLPDDPASIIARLARLRDAGLITNSEFEEERRTLLDRDRHSH